MAYIGRTPDIGNFEKQILTPDSVTTTFTLTYAVGSANSLLVVYGGVVQEPQVAYSVSGGGQSIAFSEAPATGTTTYIIYLGKQLTTPRAAGQETTKQTFAGNGSTVTFTLTDPPVVPAGIMVFVDGILQREGSGNNYVSSGSTITFSSAPDSSAEIDVYTLVKEKVSIDTVADGSITSTKLAAGAPTWNGAGETVIATASTGNSLRITNTGSGNALLVEDATNPDATAFAIDSTGTVLVGTTTAQTIDGITPAYQQLGANNYAGMWLGRYSANNTANYLYLTKSRSATVGTNTIVNSGDDLGTIAFYGADGTNLIPAATILGEVDGTPGTNDMPGRLVFSTTADGASTVTERMRIDSAGDVGIGTTTPLTKLEVAGSNNSTWSATTTSISGTTMTIAGTVTGTIAIGDLVYGTGVQPYTRITAGSALSWTVSVSQTVASATLVGGATYSSTLIRITEGDSAVSAGQPTGGLQFYTTDATAPTAGVGAYVAAVSEDTSPDTALVFGTRDDAGGGVDANERVRIDSSGNVGIGVTPSAGQSLVVGKDITGAVGSYGVHINGTIQSGVTSVAWGVRTNLSTVASAFTLANLRHHDATQGTFGAGSTVTNQSGFFVDNSLTGATNNYGFFGNLASAANVWNLYMAGTAVNYMNGSLGIGTNAPAVKLDINGITGWLGGTTGQTAQIVGANSGLNGGSNLRVLSNTTQAADVGGSISLGGYYTSTTASVDYAQIIGAKENSTSNNAAGYLAFGTRPAGLNMTERMRIDSGGNLLVGTTSTLGAKFALYGTQNGTNNNIQITNPGVGTGCLGIQGTSSNFKLYNCYTSGTLGTGAGIDIDTSGNVLVGTTSVFTGAYAVNIMGATSSRAILGLKRETASTTGVCGSIQTFNGSNNVTSIDFNSNGANNNGYIQVFTWSAGTSVAGPFVNTGGTSWTTASDETLKDIIAPIENATSKLSGLRTVFGKYKTDHSDVRRIFLIAQDVQTVLPEAVNLDTNGKLGLNYQDLVPVLVAAIKEQQALITQLQADVAALKVK